MFSHSTAGRATNTDTRPARAELEDRIVRRVAARTGLPVEEIDPTAPFVDFGLSSRDAVGVIGELQAELSRSLSPALLWEHPTARALSEHLADGDADGADKDVADDDAGPASPSTDGSEPVAVIGIGCRFPGADGPEEFWARLTAGEDLVGEPGERHELLGAHGPLGLLRNIEEFDAEFFSVSGREAAYLDPQQRMLLETSWEALESAGIAPTSLTGTDTGVFVGISASDYGRLQGGATGALGPHSGSGQALAMAANRVSYVLGLGGPSLAVDTACSSSLVAVHLACRSLRSGESATALAGGVNLILTPDTTEIFTQAGMMAADGRCKTFDSRADGYVRAEGCGVVVLKRLADARRDGDPVLAVIRGSAVNQDGRSNGLTAPNGASQQRVVQAALQDAGVAPADVDYVEAHGTGTPLGDPIETRALTRVLAAGRPAGEPLLIGSVKTNIGHAEAAAGIAGLIKTVLALRHRLIPPHLHLTEPNPDALEAGGALAVPTAPTRWPAQPGTHRTAGVSSFGFGGTNSHVVLTEAPAEQPVPARSADGDAGAGGPDVHVLALSARSQPALHALVGRYAHALDDPDGPGLGDLCHTANTGRTQFAQRFALTAATREEARERAAAWLEDGRGRGVRSGPAEQTAGGSRPGSASAPLAFLFGGQGTEYPHMGRRLYGTSPVFRREMDRLDEIAEAHLGRTVSSVLFPSPADRGLLERTRWTQPALFAVEYALAQLWRSWGVEPDYLLGHSVGALAAACVAGVFGPEDGLRLAAARGRLVEELCPPGRMMLALAAEADVRAVLEPLQSRWTVVVAAANGERNTVISGEADGIDAARHAFARRGVPTHDLTSRYAFHSPLTAPARAAVLEAARAVEFSPPRIPLVNDVDGRLFDAERPCDAAHWARHLEEPVRFAEGVRTLAGQGCSTFLETGPGRVLSGAGRRTVPEGLWLTSLRDGADDWSVLADSVAALHVAGRRIDWAGFGAGRHGRRVPMLPTYPFERRRHWLPSGRPAADASPALTAAPAPRMPAEPRPEGPDLVDNRPSERPTANVLAVLTGILGRLLENEHAPEPDATFLELGADSLTLMHTLQAVQQTFEVSLPVARLFEEVNTLRLLADHVEAHAPGPVLSRFAQPSAGRLPAAAPAAPAVPAVAAVPAESLPVHGTAVEQFLSVHARVMDQAYALLQGTGTGTGPAPDTVRAPAPAQVPAPAVGTEAPAPTAPADRTEHAPAPVPRAAPDTFVPFRPATAAAPSRPAGQDPARRQYIADLVDRYCARTSGSKAQAVRERAFHADVRHAPQPHLPLREARYPLVVDRSRGSRLWDVDGNEYIDLTMGFGVNFFGHGERFIETAVTEQLGRGMQLGPHNTLAADTAELVCELTGHERTVFCNTGSEAVMVAVRLARAVTGRTKVALFAGAYHGSADAVLAMQNPAEPSGATVPLAPGVPQDVAANALVLPYDDPASLTTLREHAHELAAVLVEPVQSRRPDVQPGSFLRELRDLTRDADVPLIFDEVITGFRMHPGGAQALFGVQADMAVYGKVMGGGMPIGAVAGRSAFLDAVDGGAWSFGDAPYRNTVRTFYTGTFCKHPVALAAGRAVLQELKRRGPELQEAVNGRVAALATAVNDLFEGAGVPVRLTFFGSLFRFRFERETALSEAVEVFHTALADKGIYVWEGRNCFLSTAHTDEDVATVVEALAETADEMTEAGFFPGARTIRPPAAMPPGDTQHELWLLAQMGEQHSRAYNESVQLELNGRVDPEALQDAVQAVVARHESLRTVFNAGEGTQSVLPAGEFEVPLLDFADSEADAAAWADQPFDLEHGPLVRAAVERLADEQYRLHLCAHHTVVDGWALGVVLDEIGRLYSAALGSSAEPLPPARQYREHVQRELDRRGGEQWEADEQFWLDACSGIDTELRLPTDRPRPARPALAGGSVTVTLEAGLSRRIRTAGSRLGCTPFTLLLASYASLLHSLTGQDDLVIGVPVARRDQAGADRIVGNCSSVLPIRSALAAGASAEAFTTALQKRLVDAFAHGDYPFSRLASRLPDRGGASRQPLHSTLFNLDQAPEPPALTGLDVALRTPERRHVKCDLSIDVLRTGDDYRVTFAYSTDLFDASTVRGYADAYRDLLDAFLTDPAGPAVRPAPGGPAVHVGTTGPAEAAETAGTTGTAVEAVPAPPTAAAPERAPRNAREATLLEIWQEVTGSRDATIDDDFFALGGHSLQGTRVTAEVRARLDVAMPLRWLFDNPTVAGLAARLAAEDDSTPALGGPGERPDVVPLSYAQQRLWFLGKLEGPNPTYNLPLPLRLTGDLDTDALAAALTDVVERHEPLRTVFAEHKGIPRQQILPVEEAAPVLTKRRTEEAELEPALREAAAHPFDLSQEIPVRAGLFQLTEREHVLLIVLHHAAGDGWSLPVLARDLATAYAARRYGKSPDWAPLPVQYADYTLWQAASLGSGKDPDSLAAAQLAHWREVLADLPDELPLPTDRPRPATASYRGGQVTFTVGRPVHTALGRLAQESRASVFMVVQAALAVLLDRLGAGTDIPIGTPVAGRTDESLDSLVGFFVNTLVLRTDTSGDPTFRELVERVRETDLAAFSHQELPFEQLVRALNPPRVRARHPLFQVMLGFETYGPLQLEAAGLQLCEEPDPTDAAKFDLFLSVRELTAGDDGFGGLTACLEYSTDLFDHATAERLTSRLVHVLDTLSADPDMRCSDVTLA